MFKESLPLGGALERGPENDAPAPGIDDGIARDGDRGTENVLEDSEGDQVRHNLLPNPSRCTLAVKTVIFSFGELLKVFSFIPFFKISLCRFLNKTDLLLCIGHFYIYFLSVVVCSRHFLKARHLVVQLVQICLTENQTFIVIFLGSAGSWWSNLCCRCCGMFIFYMSLLLMDL